MQTATLNTTYNRGSVFLHWAIALFLIANIVLGFSRESFGSSFEDKVMFVHKSLGFSVLGLGILRVWWRIKHRPPPFDPVLRLWEVAVARATHALLYFTMLAIPLTGWLIVSSSARAKSFFGIFIFPALPVPKSKALHDFWGGTHETLTWFAVGLIVLHVLGALMHLLINDRPSIGRMWPGRGRTSKVDL